MKGNVHGTLLDNLDSANNVTELTPTVKSLPEQKAVMFAFLVVCPKQDNSSHCRETEYWLNKWLIQNGFGSVLEDTACPKIPLWDCSVQTSDADESALTYGPILVPKDRGYQVGSDPSNRDGSIGVKLSGVGESPLWHKSLRLWMSAISFCARTRFRGQIASRFMHAVVCVAAGYVCGFDWAPGGNSQQSCPFFLIGDLWKDQGYLPPISASLVPRWCDHCHLQQLSLGIAFPGQNIYFRVKARYKRLVPTWNDTVAAETHCCHVDHIQSPALPEDVQQCPARAFSTPRRQRNERWELQIIQHQIKLPLEAES